mmetsp:Transcript_127931/g.292275  ORF Transcript_127931/g.292275 Transcript_127931/m.292275 type:complete len:260 (+) Transcript_127931:1098-1877(+)
MPGRAAASWPGQSTRSGVSRMRAARRRPHTTGHLGRHRSTTGPTGGRGGFPVHLRLASLCLWNNWGSGGSLASFSLPLRLTSHCLPYLVLHRNDLGSQLKKVTLHRTALRAPGWNLRRLRQWPVHFPGGKNCLDHFDKILKLRFDAVVPLLDHAFDLLGFFQYAEHIHRPRVLLNFEDSGQKSLLAQRSLPANIQRIEQSAHVFVLDTYEGELGLQSFVGAQRQIQFLSRQSSTSILIQLSKNWLQAIDLPLLHFFLVL